MSSGAVTVEPPLEAAPTGPSGPGLRRYLAGGLFLLPALVILGVWIVYPTVYTIVRSFFGLNGFNRFVGIDNYKTLFTTSTLTTAIKNNLIWVAVVPAFVTRDRPHLRGVDRACQLVGRVQDDRVPPDGDLGVRDRRDLADHVRAGSEPRRGQRARALDRPGLQPARLALGRVPLDGERDRHGADRNGAEDAAPSGRCRAPRADGDPARPGADGGDAGRRAEDGAGPHRGCRLARLQARRRGPGQGREGRGRASGRDRPASQRREQGREDRGRGGRRIVRLRGRSRRAPTTPASRRRRLRNRGAASPGSGRS